MSDGWVEMKDGMNMQEMECICKRKMCGKGYRTATKSMHDA